jgi:hypothetical protein
MTKLEILNKLYPLLQALPTVKIDALPNNCFVMGATQTAIEEIVQALQQDPEAIEQAKAKEESNKGKE